MNESTPPKEERSAALSGLGTSRKRVEDARFTQGKGNYVDDILHHDVGLVGRAHRPGLQQGKAALHGQNADHARYAPGMVAGCIVENLLLVKPP